MTTTTAAQWKKNREDSVEITFPSGYTARIRAVGTDFFIRVGRIPDFCTPMVIKTLESGQFDPKDLPAKDDLKNTKEWLSFLDSLCEVAFVEPKVVAEAVPGGNEITPDDISYIDKMFVLGALGLPVRILQTFRDEQEKRMASVAVESSVPQAALGSAEDQAVG